MKFKHVLLFSVLVAAFSHCVKVTELDDRASVQSCEITIATPEVVVFDTPRVDGNEILLPMMYGKYEFPVSVTLDIITSQKIDKILGFEENNTLTFESEDALKKLHLIALSGVPHEYTVSIEVAALNEEATVLDAQFVTYSPADFIVSKELDRDVVEKQVILYALEGQSFPFETHLEFHLSPGAWIDGLEERSEPLSFVFTSYDEPVFFTVVAESGRKEGWSLLVTKVALVSGPSEAAPGVWDRLQPQEPVEFLFEPAGPTAMEWVKEPARSLLTAFVKENNAAFPWKGTVSYARAPYVMVLSRGEENSFQINKWEQQDTLYLADKIIKAARPWVFSWQRWLNPANHVESFKILNYTSQTGEMVLGTPAIDTVAGVVSIPFLKGRDFPLEITEYAFDVSDRAHTTLAGPLCFDHFKDKIPFAVASERGEERIWNVVLAPWFQTEAEVVSFQVLSYHSVENLVQLKHTQAVIHPEDSTVRLVLKAGYDFPFVIEKFALEVSARAVLEEDYSEGIVFHTIDDAVPLTVQAESYETKTWALVLEDERIEVTEAQVHEYKVLDYQGTSLTENNLLLRQTAEIDTLEHLVTLVIDDWPGKMPLTVSALMDVSKNATLTGDITSEYHTLVFESLEQEYRFEVLSESRTNRTQWTVKLEDRSPERLKEADVVDFVTGNPSSGFVFDYKYLERDKAAITLLVSERPSKEAVLTIKPTLVLSEGAVVYEGLIPGAPLELRFDTPYTFTVMAEDESFKEWTIQLVHAPQVANSRFEEWGLDSDNVFNIMPSNGKGWTTGNNPQISGTFRERGPDGSYAVKIVTILKTVDLGIVKITSLAAGTLLLGSFNFSISADAVMNPTSMTDFGIVFKADEDPIGFEIDYSYKAGAQMVQTEPYRGLFGMPAFKDPKKTDGRDMASIIVELHRSQQGRFDYYKHYDETLIAGYHLFTDGTDGWRTERFLFDRIPGKETLDMTHLVVRCSSSQYGHFYLGADGSTLFLDNFHLLYYLPGEDAVLLK